MIKLNFALILSMIMISAIASNSEWQVYHNTEGYFSKINKTNFVVTLFFDSEACKECESNFRKQFKGFETEKYLQENEVEFWMVDYHKAHFFKKHYDLEEPSQFFFSIRNQRSEFEDFNKLIEVGAQDLYPKLVDFLTEKIEGVVVELDDMKTLESILEEKKIIGVYLGEKNQNLTKYFDIAASNIDFDFYSSFNPELNMQIYRKFKDSVHYGDVFVILRSQEMINRFDYNQLVEFRDFEYDFSLKKFFEFERYPKLRDCSWNSENVKAMFHQRHHLLVFLKSKETTSSDLKEFESAIVSLPKRMIYSICDQETENMADYLHMLMLAKTNVGQTGIFIMKVVGPKNVKVKHFNQQMKKGKIGNFVFQYYERNKHYFDDPKRKEDQEKDGKFTTQEM